MVKRFSVIFLKHLFFFYVLWGLLNMLGLKSYEGGMMKVTCVIAVACLSHNKWKGPDFFVLIFIIYAILSYLWGKVSLVIYLDGILTQILPISMYYIAKSPWFKENGFLINMRWPLFFSMVFAIYLYFAMPSWYLDFKTKEWLFEKTGEAFYENMRLSGFWTWSYFLGYASLFFIMYELKRYVVDNESKYVCVLLLPALVVLFFAQQRVSIAFFFVYIFILLVYSRKYNALKFKSLRKTILVITLVLTAISFFVLSTLDDGLIDYILDRSVNSDSNIVTDRIGLYEKRISTISFLGDGLGYCSHFSRNFTNNMISDCDYLRILNELGVLGFSILLLIIMTSLVYGCKNFKTNLYETCIIIFLLFAMIGAAPLELLTLHPYMYWYCIGRIFR